jgi:hypothetical protein
MSKEKVSKYYDRLSNSLDTHDIWDKLTKMSCDETDPQMKHKPKKEISQHGDREVVCQTNSDSGETVLWHVSIRKQHILSFVVKHKWYSDS